MQSTDQGAHNPQLFLGPKSTTRLLEVYIKRSLSLNDAGASGRKQLVKLRKWVILDNRGNRVRRASSDSSTHRLCTDPPSLHRPSPLQPPRTGIQVRTIGKAKKSSLLRSFFSLFSRKRVEEKVECDPTETPVFCDLPSSDGSSKAGSCLPASGLKKKHSLKRFSFRSRDAGRSESLKRPSSLASADVVRLPDVVSVEPTATYFEKVSEELERIVKEVKHSPTEDGPVTFCSAATIGDQSPSNGFTPSDADTVERIISILKQQGDAIDEKIKRNSSVSNFFQKLTYGTFRQLADRYVAEIPSPLPQDAAAAPELVRFAFVLDFTAKVAGLSSQTVSRIMGFGNQYLKDRFTQTSAVHRQISEDLEGQSADDTD